MPHTKSKTEGRVAHEQFGAGSVLGRRVTGSGNEVADVDFEGGKKVILDDPRYLRVVTQ